MYLLTRKKIFAISLHITTTHDYNINVDLALGMMMMLIQLMTMSTVHEKMNKIILNRCDRLQSKCYKMFFKLVEYDEQ